jgi:asparagine synthase (glutamine-hydrolysing)
MCGITGIVGKQSKLSEATVRSAAECIVHRGPESYGFWMNEEKSVALAHQRLKIVDLTEKADQPMSFLNRYKIIYNGEVYNFPELRNELEKKGYQFTTSSDTEVILAAFDLYGYECLHHFDGMFAIAIWIEKEEKLFIARDRFGEKPVYYFNNAEIFAFASEIKSLWKYGIEKTVNEKLLYNFLAIDYTCNPGDPTETFYASVYKLPAASYLVYSKRSGELLIEKYWQIYPEINPSIRPEEAVEHLIYLLSGSVKKRLRSDVPIGTSLSGGLDSSTIVALCEKNKTSNYSHKCFTAIFEDFEKNEKEYASTIVNEFGLEFHPVEISIEDVPHLMQLVMHAQDEPITSGSALVQYAVYREAKKNGIKVLLDGQGADEILGGYHKYYKWYWQELYRNRKLRSSHELQHAKQLGIREHFNIANKLTSLFPDFMTAIHQSRKARRAYLMPDFDKEFSSQFKNDLYYTTPASYDLNGILYFNTFVNGLEELLRFADRNSMANSVEIRLPFLNHELVNYLFTLPPSLKIKDGWTKWILRKGAEPMLPSSIVWRKDKIGFEPPQKKWMENTEVQQQIIEAKKTLAEKGILNKECVHKKITPHKAYVLKNNDWKYWSASYLFK